MKKIIFKILKIIFIFIVSVLILYSAAFSIAGTYLIYKAYHFVMTPWKEMKNMVTENPAESVYMTQWRKLQREKGESDSISHIFIPLDSISKHLPDAVLAAEDDGFWVHPGFNPIAMLEAYQDNISAGKIKRGGSTITQQLAKNMFLTNEKSFDRKFRELAYTVLIEKYWGKKRILELYLNYAEWGPGIFGCEA
ncbi:MAG: transglycosylase domain-containing protein, partial [Fibrobacteres bacterium]|nr:transglycosylase domain-containing protein [Fibrobacterota bacterium]